MGGSWYGEITLDGSSSLRSVTITGTDLAETIALRKDHELHFLSCVSVAHLPLCMVAGGKLSVTTSDAATRRWFSDILLRQHHEDTADEGWNATTVSSSVGVLVSVRTRFVDEPRVKAAGPAITELVIFASWTSDPTESHPTLDYAKGRSDTEIPHLELYALPLSSHLLAGPSISQLTPPSSPARSSTHGRFLPPSSPTQVVVPEQTINRPPARKRKSANEALDEANERRHKARRAGGESVAAAAVVPIKHENMMPNLHHAHRRSLSSGQSAPLQTRPLSRSPSISSVRPTSAREASIPAPCRRSTLSRVQSASLGGQEDSTEANMESRNKQTISKIVMAGMRLFGWSQSKTRKPRAASVTQADLAGEPPVVEGQTDEEYKLLYHQVFKATAFAFRQHMATANLQSRADAVRETVDKFLCIFCNDPMVTSDQGEEYHLTPGGRHPFGSVLTTTPNEQHSPFQQSQVLEGRRTWTSPAD